MPNPLRYTGEFPPVDVIQQYPNWDYALEEEGIDGQDESTLRPEPEQSCITNVTAFTAGDILLASGENLLGLIEVIGCKTYSVEVFEGNSSWRVLLYPPTGKWQPYIEDWLPENERRQSVALADPRVFPLRVASRLPLNTTGVPWRIEIRPDGTGAPWP